MNCNQWDDAVPFPFARECWEGGCECVNRKYLEDDTLHDNATEVEMKDMSVPIQCRRQMHFIKG